MPNPKNIGDQNIIKIDKIKKYLRVCNNQSLFSKRQENSLYSLNQEYLFHQLQITSLKIKILLRKECICEIGRRTNICSDDIRIL